MPSRGARRCSLGLNRGINHPANTAFSFPPAPAPAGLGEAPVPPLDWWDEPPLDSASARIGGDASSTRGSLTRLVHFNSPDPCHDECLLLHSSGQLGGGGGHRAMDRRGRSRGAAGEGDGMTSELVGVLLGLCASCGAGDGAVGRCPRTSAGVGCFREGAAWSRATHRPRSGAAASPRGKRGRRRRLCGAGDGAESTASARDAADGEATKVLSPPTCSEMKRRRDGDAVEWTRLGEGEGAWGA